MKSLSEYRKEYKLSQVGLSKKLNEVGISVSSTSIAMYEIGQRTPTLDKARLIAQFFGVSTDDIEYGPNSKDLAPTG